MKNKKDDKIKFSLFLDKSLNKELEKMKNELGKSKSAIIREALSYYIKNNELDDFSFALDALNELKSGDYTKAAKKLDDVIAKLKE